MCGRYTTNTEEELIEVRSIINEIAIRIANEDKKYLDTEVNPGSKAPIITKEKDIRVLKWGFVKWDNKGLIFNARSENASTSKYFSPLLEKNRCVIPASNYFEWQKKDKEKIKYRFNNSGEKIMYFAGIIRIENDNSESYTILTCNASEDIEFIHDRMPLILKPNEIEGWLNGSLKISDLEKNVKIYYEKC